MIDFFISYNRADVGWAKWIDWQLREAGYSTVVQVFDFRPGCNFVIEMDRATREAERTIAVRTTGWWWVAAEEPATLAVHENRIYIGLVITTYLLAVITCFNLRRRIKMFFSHSMTTGLQFYAGRLLEGLPGEKGGFARRRRIRRLKRPICRLKRPKTR